jgi:hypothetical protein
VGVRALSLRQRSRKSGKLKMKIQNGLLITAAVVYSVCIGSTAFAKTAKEVEWRADAGNAHSDAR